MTTTAKGALAALVVLGALVACDVEAEPRPTSVGDAGEPADPQSDVQRPEATFSPSLIVHDSEVWVSWDLTNYGDEPLLVVNRLPTPSGSGFTPDRVYVFGQEDGRVQLSQRVFPWPDSDRVSFAQAPQAGVLRLLPGETTSGDAAVPLPLERAHPFGQDVGFGPIGLPDPAEEVVFCLGVIPPPFEPALGMDREGAVTTIDHGNESHEAQYLFCSEPTALG